MTENATMKDDLRGMQSMRETLMNEFGGLSRRLANKQMELTYEQSKVAELRTELEEKCFEMNSQKLVMGKMRDHLSTVQQREIAHDKEVEFYKEKCRNLEGIKNDLTARRNTL
jgi:chromosome segregation ATPase